MNQISKIIQNYGLEVISMDNRYIRVKAKNLILTLDSYSLFGLTTSDMMLSIKQQFYHHNVKIDLYHPKNNHSEFKNKKSIDLTITEKKEKIRKMLKNKYKLL